jgi:hypothetical protein
LYALLLCWQHVETGFLHATSITAKRDTDQRAFPLLAAAELRCNERRKGLTLLGSSPATSYALWEPVNSWELIPELLTDLVLRAAPVQLGRAAPGLHEAQNLYLTQVGLSSLGISAEIPQAAGPRTGAPGALQARVTWLLATCLPLEGDGGTGGRPKARTGKGAAAETPAPVPDPRNPHRTPGNPVKPPGSPSTPRGTPRTPPWNPRTPLEPPPPPPPEDNSEGEQP